jgi:L-asparaginase / beta-aspartyl-peptidase
VDSGIVHGPAVAIHGGAGGYREGLGEPIAACLGEVLDRARLMLERGDDAVSVAVYAVSTMESFEFLNAGYGSALCSDGTVEMSASVMRGSDRAAGAVAGVRHAEHPIRAAAGLLDAREVLLIGEAADRHAVSCGVEHRPNEFFVTARQRDRLRSSAGEHGATVGAVCLDLHGALAAATSTGGVRGQPPGRVGDSPLVGAGTWADQNAAVSCTGEGEAFIRTGAAHCAARLVADRASVEIAGAKALEEVAALGASGGLIILNSTGTVAMPFTTQAMPRGTWRAGEQPEVFVDEPNQRPVQGRVGG